jgi:hypothetical protein
MMKQEIPMSRNLTIASLLSLTSVALLAGACTDDAPGTITATVYGEDFIEEGIPADAFGDGWAVSFDKFLVSIGGVAAKAGERGREVGDPGFYLVDLAQASGGEGHELATFAAPAGTYDHYGYRLASSADAAPVNVDAAAAAAMKAAGYSIWLAGSATNGAATKTFDWGFTLKLTHAHCDVSEKIDGGAATMQATIHADHFFYDDAVSEEPNVMFPLIAAADGAAGAPADGAITMDELAAVDIRAQPRYQVGSSRDAAGKEITNLRQYIELQATTLGHINGEGHCEDLIVAP